MQYLDEETTEKISFCNPNLNDSQRDAVRFVLRAKEMGFILGPPGTGKTTSIVEVIRQAAQFSAHNELPTTKSKILVCAPSNIAIDNIVEKLAINAKGSKLKFVRLGHPARLLDSVLKYSLDYNLSTGEGSKIVNQIRKDIENAYKTMSNRKQPREVRNACRNEVRLLRKELKQREKQAVEEVIRDAQVVLCTTTGANDYYLREVVFDWVIVDEAAQAMEIASWMAMLKGKRAILAGNLQQLVTL